MSFIRDLRVKYHQYKFNNAVKTVRVNRASVNFAAAKTVGLLFDATDLDRRQRVLKFADELKKQGKKISLLGFLQLREDTENFAFPHFNLKDLDWGFGPGKSIEVQGFTQQNFDVLINLSLTETIPLEYIAAISKAKFRVGPSVKNPECYEMMIDVSQSNSLEAYIKQVLLYLGKMNQPASA